MKKTIYTIIIGVLIGTVSSVLASSLMASQISYSSKDKKWNVSNVEAAIDSLYYYNSIKTPVGEIINYMGTIVPDHYLECDGKAYKISDYPILAEHIKTNFGSYNYFGGDGTTTFAVPDLRGEFLRGSGTNSHSNQGNGANVGTHQDATRQPEIGIYPAESSSWVGTSTSAISMVYDKDYNGNTSTSKVQTVIGQSGAYSTSNIDYSEFYTSRPTNTSVMYAIRYE